MGLSLYLLVLGLLFGDHLTQNLFAIILILQLLFDGHLESFKFLVLLVIRFLKVYIRLVDHLGSLLLLQTDDCSDALLAF